MFKPTGSKRWKQRNRGKVKAWMKLLAAQRKCGYYRHNKYMRNN